LPGGDFLFGGQESQKIEADCGGGDPGGKTERGKEALVGSQATKAFDRGWQRLGEFGEENICRGLVGSQGYCKIYQREKERGSFHKAIPRGESQEGIKTS